MLLASKTLGCSPECLASVSRDLDGFLVGQLAGEDEPVLPFSYFPLSYAYQASLPKGTGVS